MRNSKRLLVELDVAVIHLTIALMATKTVVHSAVFSKSREEWHSWATVSLDNSVGPLNTNDCLAMRQLRIWFLCGA